MRSEICLALCVVLMGCGSETMLRVTSGADWHAFVRDRDGGSASADLESVRFKPELCSGEDLRPEYARLDERSLLQFFERQRIDARVERPRADLVYVTVSGAGTEKPVRLRVAILNSAAEAGRELQQGILQHGSGWWGVHRSNLAVLGPGGSLTDTLAFAGMTKLACWGVFTAAGTDDVFVVPGGYTEL
jgi:hypothetical protein